MSRPASVLVAALLLCGCSGGAFGTSEVEDAVRATMKDPEAAQFQSIRRCSGDQAVWSGEVNGKNAFGAYGGFKSFLYSAHLVAFVGDSSFSALMDRCYSDLSTPGPVSTLDPGASDIDADNLAVMPSPNIEPDQDPAGDRVIEDEGIEAEVGGDVAAADACWSDYCPCETSDPDHGGMDVTLCRQIKMGQPVSADLFSAGAGMRDARKAMREFKDQNGEF